MAEEKDWKLKLRYGKIKTPYSHYSLIAPVLIESYIEDFEAAPGKAYISIMVWAVNIDQAADVLKQISNQTGFKITGNIECYQTDAVKPPGENPFAYNISFTYYK